MTLKEQINHDFLAAFKAKDTVKKTFLSVLKGEIQNAESKPGFTDATVLGIVRKMEKSLKETASKGDASAQNELAYLEPYLPKLMPLEQVRALIVDMVNNGATDLPSVMKLVNTQYRGLIDNNMVKAVMSELTAA